MRYIMCQTNVTKFRWQLEVAVTNLLSLGVPKEDIFVVLVDVPDGDISTGPMLRQRYGVTVDEFGMAYSYWNSQYIPYVKPYGLWAFFNKHPEEIPYTYMYQDSDVVYRELPDESKLKVDATHWTGSDTGSYTGLSYIESKGKDLVDKMAKAAGVNPETIRELGDNIPGAQIVFNSPDPEWFKQSYIKCQELYTWLDSVESEYTARYSLEGNPDEYPIQKWTAQMWTDVWVPADNGIIWTTSPELDFCFATDDMKTMNERKIYHDAGISQGDKTHFFKGQYDHGKEPFGEDFSFVDPSTASYFYVQAINKVRS